MAWKIELIETAKKELSRLDRQAATAIRRYMYDMVAPMENPRQLGEPLVGNWKGYWRYRVGDYRVITKIQDNIVTIEVIRVGHRGGVYL